MREEKDEILEEKKQSDIMDIEDSIMNKEHEENMFNKALDKQRFVRSPYKLFPILRFVLLYIMHQSK